MIIVCFILVQERVFKEFYSYTFPSEYMSFQAFVEAMDNKLSTIEKTKLQAYFRAFDAQQKSYITYSDYLLGLFISEFIKIIFLFIS
jgi:Ca2+-binding EF-hand superfamily protein